MSKLPRRFQRKRTRRERLLRRADDLVGRLSWDLTRWWSRGLGRELRRSAARLRLR
jgi:hypothetical protein